LQITPADNVVTLTGGAPQTVAFYAALIAADGTSTDVTASTTFTVDDTSIATFAGSTLTATKSGSTTVHATAAGIVNTAPFKVVDPQVIVASGAPSGAPSSFGGATDGTRAPTIVYPADGVIVPPNMNVFEFHFLPGAGNTLFQLAFNGPGVDTKVYFPCTPVGSGCVYAPDATVWQLIAEGGRGRAAINYTLSAVDGSSPGGVGVSATQAIKFAEEDLTGGIYYWNAGAGAVMRYEFGVSGKAGELFLTAAKAKAGVCVGCHVLSRDGTKIAVGLDIPAPTGSEVLDVATLSTVFAANAGTGITAGNFFSFSPDGAQLLTSGGIQTSIVDATTGAAIKNPFLSNGTQADWSPLGTQVVYAAAQTPVPCFVTCGSTGVDKASLVTIPYASGAWGAPSTLVAYAGQNNYYPTFSPDGAWVMFNRSPSDQDSYDAKDALVWVVAAGGGTPIQLATASTGGDSWPKWTPAVQQYQGKPLLWSTFSSRRAYGLRLAAGTTAQLWMTAFDPTKASAGSDPSYPGFWLPFQDLSSGNHIAQWVSKVVRTACTSDSQCDPGLQCQTGVCKPPPVIIK
ncbi:MAG: hypothetical protein ACHREM_24270, partial [Polyangiales bacterium]